jgi:hypothetical protein
MRETVIYNSKAYDTAFDPRDENLGFAFVAPLIAAAPGIFQSVMSLFGGGRKAQFQGLAEIQQAGNEAVEAMEKIMSGLNSGQMSPAQAVSESQKIIKQFNDPTIVYPAKKGKDAEARTGFISQLNQLGQQIQAKAAAMPAGGSLAGGSLAGISTNTLLMVGVGAALFFALKKD